MRRVYLIVCIMLMAVAVVVWLSTNSALTIIGSLPRQDLAQVQKLARQDMKRQALLARSPRAFGRWLTAKPTSVRVYSSELVEVQLTCYSGNHTYLLHKHEGADGWHLVKGRWSILGKSTPIVYPGPSLLPSSRSDTCPLYSSPRFGQPRSGATGASALFDGETLVVRAGGGVGAVRSQSPSGMVSNSHSGMVSGEPFAQAGQTNLAQPPVFAPEAGLSNHARLRY